MSGLTGLINRAINASPGWEASSMLPLQRRVGPAPAPVMGTDESGRVQQFNQPGLAFGLPSAISSPVQSLMTSAGKVDQGQVPDTKDVMPFLLAAATPSLGSKGGRSIMVSAGGRGEAPGGIVTYHGSPHMFDEFDASKIGTGEGAQAYGHGLYFAENENVAQQYKQIADRGNWDYPVEGGGKLPAWVAQRIQQGESPDQYIQMFKARVGEAEERVASKAPQYWNDASNIPGLQEIVKTLEKVKSGAGIQTPAHLYEVSIKADPSTFLHWDKPLSEQTPSAQAALAKLGVQPKPEELRAFDDALLSALRDNGPVTLPKQPSNPSGADLYHAYGATRLQEAGISGIKYLDQGSRNAGGWHITSPSQTTSGKWMVKSSDYNSQGLHFDTEAEAQDALAAKVGGQTHNYVIFDPKDVQILKRNGVPVGNGLINRPNITPGSIAAEHQLDVATSDRLAAEAAKPKPKDTK